jgi:misacylated tRNA(Ala) deacylase
MTTPLFRDDAYLTTAAALVTEADDATVVLDRSVFYAAGGGQPGDSGRLELEDGTTVKVADARYGDDRAAIRLAVASPIQPGSRVTQHLDWARRYRLMRMHTALHLLSVALPFPVTGGQIGESESRLDFDIPEPNLDRDAIAATLAELVAADHPVTSEWITDEELDASPDLVKTMAVKPPRGSGRVRLVRIGTVDLQPCGGTHVSSTAEVGGLAVTKIEKKGRQNRRIRVGLVD